MKAPALRSFVQLHRAHINKSERLDIKEDDSRRDKNPASPLNRMRRLIKHEQSILKLSEAERREKILGRRDTKVPDLHQFRFSFEKINVEDYYPKTRLGAGL